MVHCVEGVRIIDEEATYIVGTFIEFRINKICDINHRNKLNSALHDSLMMVLECNSLLHRHGRCDGSFKSSHRLQKHIK